MSFLMMRTVFDQIFLPLSQLKRVLAITAVRVMVPRNTLDMDVGRSPAICASVAIGTLASVIFCFARLSVVLAIS